MPTEKILIVDDDPEMVKTLSEVFKKEGLSAIGTTSGEEALEKLQQEPGMQAVLVDLIMPGMDGITLLEKIKERDRPIPVFIMTGYGTIESAVEAVKKGAEDYILKPFEEELLRKKIRQAVDVQKLKREVKELRALVVKGQEIVTTSDKMRKVLERANAAAISDVPILILGETGSGKEVLARYIHHRSPYAQGPFVGINCAAIPRELLESELFGHKKGAFTGAIRDSQGLFLAASNGTLFLDEIGDMPKDLQPKLLRTLEEGKVRPLGTHKEVEFQARIITATHRPLEELKTQHLRPDLFYRISTVVLEVPPLRERKEDIPFLATYFLQKFSKKYSKDIKEFSPEALNFLINHPFPGNVRELERLIENIFIFKKEGTRVEGADVLKGIGGGNGKEALTDMASQPASHGQGIPPEADNVQDEQSRYNLKSLEKQAIERALKACNYNKTKASQLLGLSRDRLYRKIKAYMIES
ncbi:MAG TPA: sigma-54-dependent transcriptional regulator [Candidatus Hypogeohydataceae bacterium YC41]